MRFAVALQVPPVVFEPDFVLPQEAVQSIERFQSEQPAQLGGGHLAFVISFDGDSLKRGTRQIAIIAALPGADLLELLLELRELPP